MKPHSRVAFLPFVRVRLKRLKPKDYTTEPTTLGGDLLKRTMELGLTQPEAAMILGFSSATVLGWERRGRMPVIGQYPAVIRFLGYDPTPTSDSLRDRFRAKRREQG